MITISGAMRTAHYSISARLSQHFRLVERRSSVRARGTARDEPSLCLGLRAGPDSLESMHVLAG